MVKESSFIANFINFSSAEAALRLRSGLIVSLDTSCIGTYIRQFWSAYAEQPPARF